MNGRRTCVAAFALVLATAPARAQNGGSWAMGPADAQVLAVHAALLRNGKILYFGGSQHDADKPWGLDGTRIYDPATNTVTKVPSPPEDLFCAGHAQLADGRIAVVGGTFAYTAPDNENGHQQHGHFIGLRSTWIFDPGNNTWTKGPDMNTQPDSRRGGGRWYPSVITMHDGSLVAVGGHPMKDDTRHTNNTPEVWSGHTGDPWRFLHTGTFNIQDYPRMFLISNGRLASNARILFASPVENATMYMRPSTPLTWERLTGVTPDPNNHGYGGTAVLLPLDMSAVSLRPTVMMLGAPSPWFLETNPSSGTVAQWATRAGRALPGAPVRMNSNSVILPTGEVAWLGGVKPENGQNLDRNAVKEVEIYNGTWRVGPAATYARNYHSVSLLMPDGRVFVAGGNIDSNQSQVNGIDYRRKEIEIYQPWYHGRSDRPRITSAPSKLAPGQGFDVTSDQSIAKITLIRAGTVTHSFNYDQRCIVLKPTTPGTTVRVSPPHNYIAPPGAYILYVLNAAGVPSTGKMVMLESKVMLHTAITDNILSNFTYIDDPFANDTPGAAVHVTPNWNPPGSSGVNHFKPVGVWYDTGAKKWAIYDESRAAMPNGAAFNIKIEPPSINLWQGGAGVHVASATNSGPNYTNIDDPALNNNPNARVIVTHNWGSSGIYNDHPVGVWYTGSRWSIFNEDITPIPVGMKFNYRVVTQDSILHVANSSNIFQTNNTVLDHPRLNGRPTATMLVTHNWSPPTNGGQYNNSHVGVYYSSTRQRWIIFNEKGLEPSNFNIVPITEGTAFNVQILN